MAQAHAMLPIDVPDVDLIELAEPGAGIVLRRHDPLAGVPAQGFEILAFLRHSSSAPGQQDSEAEGEAAAEIAANPKTGSV
jgi:hypothetical protein